VAGAASPDQIPRYFLQEVAFIGRSNVGKSSLINALTRQKDCARISKTPGCTRQINFFTLANKISLVDLPGYGYATTSREMRRSWDHLILNYLLERPNLRRVFLLIDSRHGIKKNDEEIMEILDNSAVMYQVILTKIDKIKNEASIEDLMKSQIANHAAAHPVIISTSSKKTLGIQEIREEIWRFI
jgi:GTP-binding protein